MATNEPLTIEERLNRLKESMQAKGQLVSAEEAQRRCVQRNLRMAAARSRRQSGGGGHGVTRPANFPNARRQVAVRSSCPVDSEPLQDSGFKLRDGDEGVFENAEGSRLNAEGGLGNIQHSTLNLEHSGGEVDQGSTGGEWAGAASTPAEKQREFERDGKADSANARMIEFFMKELTGGGLNRWFPRTLLKEVCGNDLINNRAIDCRPHFWAMGFHIDQAQIAESELGEKTSHYRVCRVEEAVSLTMEQKFERVVGRAMEAEEKGLWSVQQLAAAANRRWPNRNLRQN